jgi:hypothetical protein
VEPKRSHSKPTSSSFIIKTTFRTPRQVERVIRAVPYVQRLKFQKIILKEIKQEKEPFVNNAGSEFTIHDREPGYKYYYFSASPKQLKIQDDYISVHFRTLEVYSSKRYEVTKRAEAERIEIDSNYAVEHSEPPSSPLPKTKRGLRAKIEELKRQIKSLKRRHFEEEPQVGPENEEDEPLMSGEEDIEASELPDEDEALNPDNWMRKVIYPGGKFSPALKKNEPNDNRRPKNMIEVSGGVWIEVSNAELEDPERRAKFDQLEEHRLQEGYKRRWNDIEHAASRNYYYFTVVRRG